MARAPKEDQTPRFVKFPLKHCSKEPACRFTSRDRFELPDGLENAGIRLDWTVVLDTDPKNMPEGMTLNASNALLRAYGVDLDKHPRVRTGSGGEYLYARNDDPSVRFVARLLPWIDVKAGRGAYVVAPGSVHPNGGRYEALNRVKLRDAPPLPAKLMRTLERPAASPDGSAPGMLEPGQLAQPLSRGRVPALVNPAPIGKQDQQANAQPWS